MNATLLIILGFALIYLAFSGKLDQVSNIVFGSGTGTPV